MGGRSQLLESGSKSDQEPGPPKSFLSNRALLLPYLAPYVAYVGLGAFRLPTEWIYALRLVAVPALLAWGWRWFPRLTGPRSPLASLGVGAAAGLVGTALWVALLWPFVEQGGTAWTGLAFGLRLTAAGLVVPVFEELLMRGYFLRVALQWDQARREGAKDALLAALDGRSLLDVEAGAWSPWAATISTAAFTLGHDFVEWPACVAYGLLMIWLWAVRRDLLSCIVAHGVTNVALAVFVGVTGRWQFW